ncbi:MAG: Obg family GTPase CgtA, partial [Actinomycetota bacterium]
EAELAAYPVEGADGRAVPLTERPRLVVLNKVDVPEARELAELVRPELEARGLDVFEVSAASHEGLRELAFAMARIVQQSRAAAAPVTARRVVLRPTPVDETGFTVTREDTPDGELYRVRGAKPERWVRQTDFANDEAVGYLADRLARLGVEEELFAVGAKPGDTVVVGGDDGVVFDWEPTLTPGAEMLGARGSDLRLEESSRPTRGEKREVYAERRAARSAARAELEQERRAGHWTADDDTVDGEQA